MNLAWIQLEVSPQPNNIQWLAPQDVLQAVDGACGYLKI